MGYVKEVTPGDIQYVAEFMREADRNEIAAHSGLSPLAALTQAVEGSTIACTVQGKYPSAIFGVARHCEISGSIWLLGTPELTQPPLKFQFLKQSRFWVERLHDVSPLLWNCVDERNITHIRWIKWVGGVFIQRHEHFGVQQKPFLEFVRIKNV